LIAVLYQGVCIVLMLAPESLHIHSIIFRALAVQHFHHVLFLELGRGEKIVKVERFHGAALRECAFVVFARSSAKEIGRLDDRSGPHSRDLSAFQRIDVIVRGAGVVDGVRYYRGGLFILAVFRLWVMALVAGAFNFPLPLKIVILWRALPGWSIFGKAAHPIGYRIDNFFRNAFRRGRT